MFHLRLLWCVMTLTTANSSRILGIVPTPSYSHQIVFQPIWKELSLRGHQVTTITTNPINDSTLVNLTEIDLGCLYKTEINHIEKIINLNLFGFMFAILDAYDEMAHNFLSHRLVQNLIRNDSERFDVVMVEFGLLSMFAFAKRFDAPLILLTSIDAPSHVRSLMGNPTHPILYPEMILPFEDNLSLGNRLLIVTFTIFLTIIKTSVIVPSQQLLVNKYFGPHYPPISELQQNISLALINSDPIFHRVKPLVPTIIQIGGGFHRTVPKPLPKDLEETLNAAENGFIYFSLGSTIKSKEFSEETKNVCLETFAELPYLVLWKFEDDTSLNKPKNVITSKWFPQQDVFSIAIESREVGVGSTNDRNKVNMFHLRLLCCVMTLTTANASRILGIVPTPSYSHQMVFQPIWKELSLRGHQVTTITTNPINDSTLVNLTEIDLGCLYKTEINHIEKIINLNLFGFMFAILDAYDEMAHNFLSHRLVQNVIRNDSEKFDVVMVEFGLLSMFAFAKRFNAPLILLTSIDAPSHVRSLMGNPTHPILYPEMILPFENNLSLGNRLLIVTFTIFLTIIKTIVIVPSQQLLVNKYFGSHYPSISDLQQNISLALINSDPIFHRVKPLVPTIIQIGGGFHRTVPKPLPKDLEETLNAAENGVIYFSLGSTIKSKEFSEETKNVFLETFAELPYLVLWKFEDDTSLNKPKNVITSKWFPQQDVFKHPKIKLFITQGGLQSMDEAIYDHIPMIGIPFMGDQKFNVNKMVNKGFGLSLDYKTLSKEKFKTTIFEVINNPKYRNRIKELAKLALDQPMTGLEKAVWWTEYVIRHNGTKHLRSPMLDIPFYQYYFLDIAAVAFVLLIVVIVAIAALIKLLKKLTQRKKLKTF
ncbi:hypothetical protein RN001_014766 [Aquatica leii]|uniref:UDP-glycosyltransferases domain-containing protein n=1 Tax=Aquatica leii TaxID=1421715 RepID=A0AAN7PPS8_9COLE|nr:hypothetical protein RN001_014766 [Aquatica leii]